RPGERPIFDHALVATPHVVHQNVDRARLAEDAIERRLDVGVDSMVASNARDPLVDWLVIGRRSARDEDPRALSSELARDPSADALGRSRHDGDPTVKTH